MKTYRKRALRGYDDTSKKTNFRNRRERQAGRREVWEALNKADTSNHYTAPRYMTLASAARIQSIVHRGGVVEGAKPWWDGL